MRRIGRSSGESLLEPDAYELDCNTLHMLDARDPLAHASVVRQTCFGAKTRARGHMITHGTGQCDYSLPYLCSLPPFRRPQLRTRRARGSRDDRCMLGKTERRTRALHNRRYSNPAPKRRKVRKIGCRTIPLRVRLNASSAKWLYGMRKWRQAYNSCWRAHSARKL